MLQHTRHHCPNRLGFMRVAVSFSFHSNVNTFISEKDHA